MTTEKIYVPTPISESPKEDGWYVVVGGYHINNILYFSNNIGWDGGRPTTHTHYLQPVERIVLTEEEYQRRIVDKENELHQLLILNRDTSARLLGLVTKLESSLKPQQS